MDSCLTELKTGQMDYDLYHHGYFDLVTEMVYGPYSGVYHETLIYLERGVCPVRVGVVYPVKVDDRRSEGEVWRTN
jgi:hypothetical protein